MKHSEAALILKDTSGGPGERWAIRSESTTIGRGEGSDVILSDREVSRKHAQIRHDGAVYLLVDLGSRNGTFLNGIRIERATALTDGDEILIAPRFTLLFIDSDATLPARPAAKGILVDPITRNVTLDGQVLDPPLPPNQFALLQLLASQPGRVFTRDDIAAACYPEAQGGVSDDAIDGIVRRLRARLLEADPHAQHIVVLRGHGFRLAT